MASIQGVGAETGTAVGASPAVTAPDPIGLLWQRLMEHGVTGIEPQAFQGQATFDTDALAAIINRRGTLGSPNSWPVLDFVCSLRRPEIWEGLVMPGRGFSEPLIGWVMLHGPRDPERSPVSRVHDRPSVLVHLSGYSALRRTCDSLQLTVSPIHYDGRARQWLGACTERMVLGYGSLASAGSRPPDTAERALLGNLAQAVNDVLPLPPGVYRSEYSER